ncbi:MAG: phosphate ABC transporter permease subunit PstC, partial [Castellaniella sp.]
MANTQRSLLVDAGFRHLTRLFAFLVFILLAGILASLVYGSRDSLAEYGLPFLWTNDWDPVRHSYGALVPMLGTVISAFIALLIAVPVSFGIAMFLTELAPVWLRRPLGVAIEMLAAIPSIIYGMWGLFVFVPLFQEYVQPHVVDFFDGIPVLEHLFGGPPMGIGLFTAGLILSIMIIPFIAAVMRDVFEQVPPMLKESAYGLGSTTWEVVWKIMLPYTKHGVIGGIM